MLEYNQLMVQRVFIEMQSPTADSYRTVLAGIVTDRLLFHKLHKQLITK